MAAERALVNHNLTGDVPDGVPPGGERTSQDTPSRISSQCCQWAADGRLTGTERVRRWLAALQPSAGAPGLVIRALT
jgi:hypothetical protein